MVSGLHARIEASDGGFILVHESRSNKTLLNDAVIETSHRIQSGDRVKLGYTGPTIELVSIESAPQSPQPDADGSGQTMQADPRQLALLRGTLGTKRIEIGGGGMIGRDPQLQFPLDHPHVSRLHASLTVRGDHVVLADLRQLERDLRQRPTADEARVARNQRPHRHRAVLAALRWHGAGESVALEQRGAIGCLPQAGRLG